MACVHHSMSAAKKTPHNIAHAYSPISSPPLRRRSITPNAAKTGTANEHHATVAVVGVVAATPSSAADADSLTSLIVSPTAPMRFQSIVFIDNRVATAPNR